MARASAKLARPTYEPDADEAEALAVAAATLQSFARVENAEAVASAVISKWIIERMKRVAAARLADNVVFDLGDAKLRGMIETALPQIGEALSDLPSDVPFFSLDKETVISVFVAGCTAWREAAVAVGEAGDFPFSDPIPFGAPISDEELPH